MNADEPTSEESHGAARPGITRRGVLAVAAGGLVAGTVITLSGWTPQPKPILAPSGGARRTPLPIPPLAEPEIAHDGTRIFSLTAQTGQSRIHPAGPTPSWGYNGAFAGPSLRAAEGDRVRIVVRNELPETTTVHWHGLKLPAQYDGGPHQPIAPGEEWIAEWEIEQPAATCWYHPHTHGTTEAQVTRGLMGLFILQDELSEWSGLPIDYGVDDVPILVTDRSFNADGTFAARERTAFGLLGDTVIVNGALSPTFEVTRALTRLRLLNGSSARTYHFVVQGAPMTLVGTEAGLLPDPTPINSVTLTPGERAEVLVELEPGQTAMLQSVPHSLGLLQSTSRAAGAEDRFDVLELRAASSFAGPDLTIAGLGMIAQVLPPPLEAPDVTRSMVLTNNQINGATMEMSRVDQVVTVGARERWVIDNQHHLPHNLHIHNARFLVVSVDGEPPRDYERGWKDTVYAPPGRPVIIDVEFGRSADPEWPYMFHCHWLMHHDMGMMGQFVVIDDTQEPPTAISTPAVHAGNPGGGMNGSH